MKSSSLRIVRSALTSTEPVIRTPYDHVEPRHNAPYECIVCEGPESSATSNSGCRNCGAQDDIVPRGTRIKRLRAQWLREHGFPTDAPIPPPEEVEVDRSHSFDDDRAKLYEIEAQLLRLQIIRAGLRMRLMIDCDHEGYVVEAHWLYLNRRSYGENRLCLRCGLDLMNTGEDHVVEARQHSRRLQDIPRDQVRQVSEQELFGARNNFPQPL